MTPEQQAEAALNQATDEWLAELVGGATEPKDTRSRIQDVALQLFIEQGYEATSLREIAERLGVTKAALYYHFKSKDEIVASLVDQQLQAIDELTAWAEGQPRTAATRREFIKRYAVLLQEHRQMRIMRFFERNQTSLREHRSKDAMRSRLMRIMDLMGDPGEPLTDRMRRSLAVFALHSQWIVPLDADVTPAERRAAALQIALDLIS